MTRSNLQVVAPRVDEDGVGVAVHHLQLHLGLRHLDRALQQLAALRGDHLGQGLGVEPREGEAQAPVHGVGHDLERRLADVVLLQLHAVPLRLDQRLDLPTAVDEGLDDPRQDARLPVLVRQLVPRGVAVRRVPRGGDGREADVVLLDDAGVERVEVEEEDVLVVEPPLRLEDQAARVGGLLLLCPLLLPPPAAGAWPSSLSSSSMSSVGAGFLLLKTALSGMTYFSLLGPRKSSAHASAR